MVARPKPVYVGKLMTFSKRTQVDQTPNALSIALGARRTRGLELLDLTVSNPTTAGIAYDDEAILTAYQNRSLLTYSPDPFGLEIARQAVADDHRARGIDVAPSNIMLTASTSEAYAFLFKLLCDPGDEVLVPVPSYPLFDLLAGFEGVKLVPYPLAYDGSWHLEPHAISQAITPRTRAILVVSPNNPTGSFLKRSELETLKSTGLPILCDEVFATYPLAMPADACRSVLEANTGLVFSLGGLSKLAALPQMKLAWTCVGGEEALVREALARLELLGDTFLSVSTPVQVALPALLASRSLAERAIRERTARNLATVRSAFPSGSPISVLDVEGGWYATLRVPETESDEQWAQLLLESDGVYVHPGHFFEMGRGAYLVVSLLTPEPVLREGVRRIRTRVEQSLV